MLMTGSLSALQADRPDDYSPMYRCGAGCPSPISPASAQRPSIASCWSPRP